ncbi:protein Wnt-1-like [Varroa jacobsoni]|uniref:protein Wnt-1-like n=1 Tax=Varroa jacobsoni TaxID=62625 RepID=UPI000BF7176C|nr:protein Wnt-1-like [Varroa jacobsoni]
MSFGLFEGVRSGTEMHRSGWTVVAVIVLELSHSSHANWWYLGMPSALDETSLPAAASFDDFCRHHLSPAIKHSSRDICSLKRPTLETIGRGAQMGIEECQRQFRMSRWNCSTQPEDTKVFGGVLSINSREKAFVHAISSAGVAYSITRACSRGELHECGCDSAIRSKGTRGRWQWGGCSEDVAYGARFSRDFVDVGEDTGSAQGLMNLHNNEAGRKALRNNLELACKCHGVSGSCSLQVCWRRLKEFRAIGEELMQRYDGATQVQASLSRGRAKLKPVMREVKRPGKKDLVYIDDSPDYCQKNETLGVYGTSGRACNASSYGLDGCRLLCCGRGYVTIVREVDEKCNCKFVWCCEVKCETCRVKKVEHFCK